MRKIFAWILLLASRYCRKPKVLETFILRTLASILVIFFTVEDAEAIKELSDKMIKEDIEREKGPLIIKLRRIVTDLEQRAERLRQSPLRTPESLALIEKELDLARSVVVAMEAGGHNIFAEHALFQKNKIDH